MGREPSPDPYTPRPSDADSSVTLSPTAAPDGEAVDWPQLPAGCRYRLTRFLARGGLGAVFVAVDTELDREVAVKFVRKDKSNAARWRFKREAEITGRLEHPGIAPVFGLLELPDGGFCYAMRLLRGETLKVAIEHRRDQRRLLGHFVAVCNTVAFAHDNGVIHRDLKPANVMLGPYGETWVVDWGLATAAGDHDPVILSPSPDPGETPAATRAGDMIGTPGFMSPEQLNGEKVGPAADVFALGTTLGAVLTGKPPPAWGTDANWLDRKVPPALRAVCAKAMAFDPAERFATARELAAEVEHYLADEPLDTHRDPIYDRARRWAKRNRAVVAATAVALVVGLAASAAGLAVVSGLNRDLDRVNADLATTNDDLKATNQELEAARAEAVASMTAAKASEAAAAAQRDRSLETVRKIVADVDETPYTPVGVQELRVRVLSAAEAGLDRLAPDRTRDAKAAMLRVDIHLSIAWQFQNLHPPKTEATVQQLRKAEAILEAELSARPKDTPARLKLAQCLNQLVGCLVALRDLALATKAAARELEVAESLAADQPGDVQATLASARAYGSRSNVNANNGRPADEVVSPAREAVRRTRVLFDRDPKDADVRWNWVLAVDALAHALGQHGQSDAAVTLMQEVEELLTESYRGVALGFGDQLLWARLYRTLGLWESFRGHIPEALIAYESALRSNRDIEAVNQENASIRFAVAECYAKLGYTQWQLGRYREAIQSAMQGVDRFSRLLNEDDRNSDFLAGLLECCMVGLNVSLQTGQLTEGALVVKYGLDRSAPSVAKYPDDMAIQLYYANSLFAAGLIAQAQGNLPEARDTYQKAADIIRRFPTDATFGQMLNRVLTLKLAILAGDAAACLKAADAMAAVPGTGWFGPFYAAGGYAVVSQKTADPAAAARHADRAVALLRKSVAAGLLNRDFIQRSVDLAPIRTHPEFQAVLLELSPEVAPAPRAVIRK